MKVNQSTTENVEVVARQLSAMMAQGIAPGTAIDTIEREAGDQYANACKVIRSALGERVKPAKFGPTPIKTFRLLAEVCREQGIDPIKVFPECHRILAAFSDAMSGYWAGIRQSMSYLYVVLAIFIGIHETLQVYVWPNFAATFEMHKASLPALSAWMFEGSASWIRLSYWIILVCLILVTTFATQLRRAAQSIRGVAVVWEWIPGFSDAASVFNWYAGLSLAGTLVRVGMPGEKALVFAAKHGRCVALDLSSSRSVNRLVRNQREAMALAQRCATLDQEIDHQVEHLAVELQAGLLRFRHRWDVALRVFLYPLVGLLLISFYLPVFKMAAVI